MGRRVAVSAARDEIARAVLHEGHLLYPYDPRALKNRHRWLFGRLYPEAYCRSRGGAEAAFLQAECVILGDERTEVSVRVRFLHLSVRELAAPVEPGRAHEEASWDAIPRDHDVGAEALGALVAHPVEQRFDFPAARGVEVGASGPVVRRTEAVAGVVELGAVHAQPGAYKLRVRVRNAAELEDGPRLADPDRPLLVALVSTQVALSVRGGALVSLREPPAQLAELARSCRNVGVWPVLVGAPGSREAMLCSPIILDDHPRIAPESPGDLFDAVEIDELLTLHILALTDDEKEAMAAADERARAVLRRTEALTPAERLRLHGRVASPGLAAARARLGPGSRVVLRPRGRADILDLALAGKTATVTGVEQDLDGRIHLAVLVDDDPGKDLGAHGHRFFFGPDEVTPLDPDAPGPA
jgi:hypothetical protein